MSLSITAIRLRVLVLVTLDLQLIVQPTVLVCLARWDSWQTVYYLSLYLIYGWFVWIWSYFTWAKRARLTTDTNTTATGFCRFLLRHHQIRWFWETSATMHPERLEMVGLSGSLMSRFELVRALFMRCADVPTAALLEAGEINLWSRYFLWMWHLITVQILAYVLATSFPAADFNWLFFTPLLAVAIYPIVGWYSRRAFKTNLDLLDQLTDGESSLAIGKQSDIIS